MKSIKTTMPSMKSCFAQCHRSKIVHIALHSMECWDFCAVLHFALHPIQWLVSRIWFDLQSARLHRDRLSKLHGSHVSAVSKKVNCCPKAISSAPVRSLQTSALIKDKNKNYSNVVSRQTTYLEGPVRPSRNTSYLAPKNSRNHFKLILPSFLALVSE